MGLLTAQPGLHAHHRRRDGAREGPWRTGGRVPAIFLDRDGVLVEDVHFLADPRNLRLLPGVVEGLRRVQDRFAMIVVTNQSGVARGYLTEDTLLAIHETLMAQLSREGVLLDALYYCPHHPEAMVEAYRQECECRKPRPGLLARAASEFGVDLARSVLIGDSARDLEAAKAMGVPGILLSQRVPAGSSAAFTASNLPEAMDRILSTNNPFWASIG